MCIRGREVGRSVAKPLWDFFLPKRRGRALVNKERRLVKRRGLVGLFFIAVLLGNSIIKVTASWALTQAGWENVFITAPALINFQGGNNFVFTDARWLQGPAIGITRTSVAPGRNPEVNITANLVNVKVIDNELWTPPHNRPYARAKLEFWEEPRDPWNWLPGAANWNPRGELRTLVIAAGIPSWAAASVSAAGQAAGMVRTPRRWFHEFWVPFWGANLPFRAAFWWRGWIDGDYGIAGAMSVYDNIAGLRQDLFSDGFFDNGDGTFSHIGSGWDPQSLRYSLDVDGNGNPGWDLLDHDLSKQENPYEYPFWVKLQEIGGDQDFIDLRFDFTLDTYMGTQPIPEPSTLLLLGSGLAGVVVLGRKKLFIRRIKSPLRE